MSGPRNVTFTDDLAAMDDHVAAMDSADKDRGPCTWNTTYGVWWQKDSSAPDCNVCSVPFSLLRRRHHCRFCGDVVCASCAAAVALHPRSGTQENICSRCSDELNKMIEQLKTEQEAANQHQIAAQASDASASTTETSTQPAAPDAPQHSRVA